MRRAFLLLLMSALVPGAAVAQSNELALTGGVFNFDLAGTGNAPMFAVKYDRALVDDWLVLEGSVTFAYPEQRGLVVAPESVQVVANRTTMVIPEALLLYQFSMGRFAPFFGGGVGTAVQFRDDLSGGNDASMTLAGVGGVKMRLRESSGIRAEFRVRGIGARVTGSAAEFHVGVFRTF